VRRLRHRLTAREARVERLAQRVEFGLRLLGRGARVVVDAPQGLQRLAVLRQRRRASVSSSAGSAAANDCASVRHWL
jgi:hypothetical protein